jgi:hypothetical protein
MWEYFGEAIDGDHATDENLVAALAAALDKYTQDFTVRALYPLVSSNLWVHRVLESFRPRESNIGMAQGREDEKGGDEGVGCLVAILHVYLRLAVHIAGVG